MSKGRTIIQVSESFTIRKIVPSDIASRYFRGEYDKRTIPETKLKNSTSIITIGKDIGKDFTSEIYRFVDRGNNNISICTTNHAYYKYVSDCQDGKIVDLPIIKCKYCKRLISPKGLGQIKWPVGIPVSAEFNGDEIVFMEVDPCCDFGCAFTYLKKKNGQNRFYKGPLYMNSEQLLYCKYYRVCPDRKGLSIKEKSEWDDLRENGGFMTDAEFDSDAVEYVPIPGLVILPCKNQYMKFHLKNIRENI